MLAFQILAAVLAVADPLPTGLDQIPPPPPTPVQAPPPASCMVDFETTLVDVKPMAANLQIGEKLKLVLTRTPSSQATAMRDAGDQIGAITADPNLATMLTCGAQGHNYQAEVVAGAYRVHVTMYPEA